MCDDSCNHSHAPETEEETQDQGHARQENKDLADISRYLEDDSFRDQTTIKLPSFLLDAKATTRSKRLEKEKQFASIKVEKAQVELLIKELEISKLAAEKLVKNNHGDLNAALKEFIKI